MRLLFSLLIVSLFALNSFAQNEPNFTVTIADSSQVLSYPLDVISIIDAKCYGCHSPKARGEKSKNALMWVELQDMKAMDLVSKLDEISEVLEKGEMPPKKFLEKYPKMELTSAETEKLMMWARNVSTKLMGE